MDFIYHDYGSVLIQGAIILDGRAEEPYKGDILVRGERIVEVGRCESQPGIFTINAEGSWVMPGLVDIHGHTDEIILQHPCCESKLLQGITTELMGNCGFSAAPTSPSMALARGQFLERQFGFTLPVRSWSMAEFLNAVEGSNPGINVATLVGHNNLLLVSEEHRKSGIRENLQPVQLLQQALDEGACGLSAGLAYKPGCHVSMDELLLLIRFVAHCGGLYTAHIRNQGLRVMEATREFISLCMKADVKSQISHLKVTCRNHKNLMESVLKEIETACEELDLAFDAYPFESNWTDFASFVDALGGSIHRLEELPSILESQGISFEDITVLNPPGLIPGSISNPMNLAQLAKSCSLAPVNLLKRLLGKSDFMLFVMVRCMDPSDVEKAISHPLASICTDSPALPLDWPLEKVHPRVWETYPTLFRKYANSHSPLNLSQAVHKASRVPAQRLGLKKRGSISRGNYADLIVMGFPKGQPSMDSNFFPDWVLVNGRIAVAHGRLTGERAGRVLRFNGNDE